MMYYLKTKCQVWSVFLLFFLIGTGSTQAQHKKVQVSFKILESGYQDFYQDALPELEEKCGEMIVAELQKEFPFVKFSTQPAENRLNVFLDRQNPGQNSPIFGVDLGMQLLLPEGFSSDKVRTEFRGIDLIDAPLPGSHQAFLLELQGVISTWITMESETIITELMSRVSLGEKAHPDVEKLFWIMPFSEDSLYIGTDSEFELRSMWEDIDTHQKITYKAIAFGRVQFTSTRYPKDYLGKILTRIKQDESSDPDMMAYSDLVIQGIFLTKFIRSNLYPINPQAY